MGCELEPWPGHTSGAVIGDEMIAKAVWSLPTHTLDLNMEVVSSWRCRNTVLMHRSTAGNKPYNLSILTIDYSKNFTTS